MSQGEFSTCEAWDAFTALLSGQLEGVDVQGLSTKDFNDSDQLIMNPPSVRSFFGGETAASTGDTQRLSSNVTMRMIVLCADTDLSSPIAQARTSLALLARVKTVLIGARLVLASGDVSEPVTYTGCELENVVDVGVAYAALFEVPGLAQFAGANAWPPLPPGGAY